MDYPLDMKLPAPQVGFAVANSEKEHKALSKAGYEPAFVPLEPEPEKADKSEK